jgi:hypothetical protein
LVDLYSVHALGAHRDNQMVQLPCIDSSGRIVCDGLSVCVVSYDRLIVLSCCGEGKIYMAGLERVGTLENTSRVTGLLAGFQ